MILNIYEFLSKQSNIYKEKYKQFSRDLDKIRC